MKSAERFFAHKSKFLTAPASAQRLMLSNRAWLLSFMLVFKTEESDRAMAPWLLCHSGQNESDDDGQDE